MIAPIAHEEKEDSLLPLNPPPNIKQRDNHVYFYDDITAETITEMIQKLKDAQWWSYSRGIDFKKLPIILHIHSYGGELYASLAGADAISSFGHTIHTVVEGAACSGATLLALAGHKRFIMPNAMFMIHQLSSVAWGTHEAFKDELMMQQKAMDMLIRYYREGSYLDEKKLKKMLKHDTWLTAQEAESMGFAKIWKP